MKTKNAIKFLLAAGILLAAVTGCANRGTASQSNDLGSDRSVCDSAAPSETESAESSSLPEASKPPEKEYVPTFDETAINSEGTVVVHRDMLRGRSACVIDNNYVYLRSNSCPTTIFTLDRSDYSSLNEVVTYDFDVEFAVFNNKYAYCGWYFAFPCYGDPYDGNGFNMRVYAGAAEGQGKCIFDEKVGSISACASELNDTEMVFSLHSAHNDIAEIYKYKVGNEQAHLIYSTALNDYEWNSCPLIACFNEQIYFIYGINDSQVVIKTLNPDGKEVNSETVDIPEYASMRIKEFTVAENNYIILFDPRGMDSVYRQALIDRKSHMIFTDFGEHGFGGRFNDSVIDGRYIIFLKTKGQYSYSYPIFSVFDDKTLEFHDLKFRALSDVEVVGWHVDYKGDIIFAIRDENRNESLVLYEDVTSLIKP